MTLRVVQPGLYTLVVDFGRPRTRSLGVSLGGAADWASLALGNALVGNPPDAAALEVTLAGPTLRAECELAGVVYGAPFALTSDRQELRAGTTFTLQPGEELRIGATAVAARAYLCVRGGFQVPAVLGSHAGFGPVAEGAELPCQASQGPRRFLRLAAPWEQAPAVLRAVDGPQADWFHADDFFGQEFVVSPASNRMGLRLRGRPLRVPGRELTSEPVCPGAVQVTRDGRCIILGTDGQTIGGYPKIAQVATADLDTIGQLRPGACLRFRRVTVAEAEALSRARRRLIQEWVTRLQTSYEGTP
jgi:5-oxoprolinase (ATP-hydrolysing) subunit C